RGREMVRGLHTGSDVGKAPLVIERLLRMSAASLPSAAGAAARTAPGRVANATSPVEQSDSSPTLRRWRGAAGPALNLVQPATHGIAAIARIARCQRPLSSAERRERTRLPCQSPARRSGLVGVPNRSG